MQRQLTLVLAAAILTACADARPTTAPNATTGVPAVDYVMVPLGHLGDGSQGWAVDINNHDQAVGVAYTSASTPSPHHAFLWENGVMQDLGTLGGSNSYAVDINDSGEVVGWANTPDGAQHAFFWEAGTMQDLGPVAVVRWQLNRIRAVLINAQGQVIGDRPGGGAFLWQNGLTQELPLFSARGINDIGQVVGSVLHDSGGVLYQRAALWKNGVVTELGTLEGGDVSSAVSISNTGWVSGTSRTGPREVSPGVWSFLTLPFLWRNGGPLQELPPPRADRPVYKVHHVTDRGEVLAQESGDWVGFWWDGIAWQVVGDAIRPGSINHHGAFPGRDLSLGAFMWDHGLMRDFDLGETWSDAIGINDANVVAGSSKNGAPVIWKPVLATVARLQRRGGDSNPR